MNTETSPEGYTNNPVRLIGNNLCLDFVNTAVWSVEGDVTHERLASLQDVNIWCDRLGVDGLTSSLGEMSIDDLYAYRAALRRVVVDLYTDTPPDGANLVDALAPLQIAPALIPTTSGVRFAKDTTLAQVIALHAATLFGTKSTAKQLKMCKSDNCGWFFLDQSRTGRRVWCCMETCGNRAKARRFSAREKEREQTAST